MKCKNCRHFLRGSSIEFSDELFDITGICNLSGAVKKSKDICHTGNYVRK